MENLRCIPTMAATVERRLLINYRVAPDVAASMLPAPFRPRLAAGAAVAGICLIRLGDLRPAGLPAAAGLRTENSAYRIAVEWDTPTGGTSHTAVYIPARHTASRLTAALGGRLFPGVHQSARFLVEETEHDMHLAFAADNTHDTLDVTARLTDHWPGSALFTDLNHASQFLRDGATGYSTTRHPQRLDGVELRSATWHVRPAELTDITSSYFDNPRTFPPGTAQPDIALVMRTIPVTWHALPPIHVTSTRSGS
jgi:Uncharacterized conserved protein (COG2071)